jgi:flagellar basal-body rod modification protein FlgD
MEVSNRSTAASAAALGGPSATTTSNSLGPDAFLRLLVTQIRNQDPMQPMDTEGMMSQLTQLTSVERLVAIDDRLATLSVATAGIGNSQAADLVGQVVEADTSSLSLVEGEATRGTFELPAAAENVNVEIRDENGRLVQTLSLGAKGPGACPFTWDGRTEDGSLAEPGRYRVSVRATTAAGNALDASMRVRGRVDAIHYDAGYPELSIGGFDVMMGDVRSVEGTPAPLVPALVPTP